MGLISRVSSRTYRQKSYTPRIKNKNAQNPPLQKTPTPRLGRNRTHDGPLRRKNARSRTGRPRRQTSSRNPLAHRQNPPPKNSLYLRLILQKKSNNQRIIGFFNQREICR